MNSAFEGYLTKYNFATSNFSSDARGFDKWPIRVKPLADNRLNDAHSHSSLQIWYTISGEYNHMLNGVCYKQTPGSAVVVFPYSIHQIDSRMSNLEELNVISVSLPLLSFTSEGIPFQSLTFANASFDSFLLHPLFQFSGKQKKAVDVLFEDILYEFRKHYDMDKKKIYSYISQFFEICSNQLPKVLSKKDLMGAQDKFECITEAVSFIDNNISSSLTLDIISREAMMSQRSFTESFKYVTGQTCHNHIKATRICNAYKLLKNSNNSLDAIAEECGFYNRAHFIKIFKEIFGITPSVWRDDFRKWKEIHEEYVIAQEQREYDWLLE